MDFVEHWFHVAPDGGNGTLEAALILLLGIFVAFAIVFRRGCDYFRAPAGLRESAGQEQHRA
jgi:hypothetical protein